MQKKRSIDRMRLIGDLSVELARFVFNVDPRHESMDDISKQFVNRLCDKPEPPTEEPEVQQQPSCGNPMVTFADDGSNNAGFIKATSAGLTKRCDSSEE